MKFKVNKIAAAVAVSLGTSVVGMNVAQADEILFPNIGMSPSVTTILSVVNDDDLIVPNQVLHYRYYYKQAAASLTAACQEADYNQNTSINDVVTFDVSGHFGDAKGVLFEPVTSSRYNKSFAIFKNQPPTRAFGIIDNNARFVAGLGISGEAFIIEFVNGSVWGYQAYNAASIVGWDGSNVVVANQYDFSDRVENNGEVLVPTRAGADRDEFLVPIAIMPWGDTIQTALFVTPIATTPPYQLTPGGSTATVGLLVNDPANPALDVMYDRDENPYSGALVATVTCIGRVNVPSLISSATQQFVKDSGGWSNVAVLSGQATVLKLEYNDVAPANLDGKPTGSNSWNNGFWLRQGIRESVARELVTVGTGSAKLLPVFDIPQDAQLNAPYPLIDTRKTTAALPFPPVYGAPAIPYIGIAASPTQPSDKQ
ncbi:MAG: hypothetical protein WAV07_16205 [Candidatus Contendobacter sp.]